MTVSTVKDLMELRGKRQVLVTTGHDAHVARMCEMAGMDGIVTYCKSRTTAEQATTIAEVRKGAPNMLIAFGQFAEDVNEGQYPGKGNVIEIKDAEFDKFLEDADRAGPRWVNYPQQWHKGKG